jgi:hypothetical protein
MHNPAWCPENIILLESHRKLSLILNCFST